MNINPCKECIVTSMCETPCKGIKSFIKEKFKPFVCSEDSINYIADSFRFETMRTDMVDPACGIGLFQKEPDGVYGDCQVGEHYWGYLYVQIDKKFITLYENHARTSIIPMS